MRNYITLNGKNSNEINGLLIQELPPISKPQIRTEVEEIDGRDGDIVTKLGFAAYDKEFTVGLYKDFDINAIIAYFNSEGTVVFSNEPDKYYNYQIIDQIDFERLVRYRTATVRMHCQPFKYSNTEGARTLGNKGTASGEGSFITLDNTPEAQFSKIDPKGNATQTTYSGKNLWTGASSPSVTGMSSTTITLPSGTYTISASSATTTGSGTVSLVRFLYDGGGDKYSSFYLTNVKLTVELTDSVKRIDLYSQGSYAASQGVTTTLTDFMIEAGSTATAYEPYVGGKASPNPDYPQTVNIVTGEQTVRIVGKNLAVIENRTATNHGITYEFNEDGTITLNGTSDATTSQNATLDYPIHIKAGQIYTFSANNAEISANVTVRLQRGNGQSGVFAPGTLNATNKIWSFSESEDVDCCLQVRIASGITLNNFTFRPQLELGNSASSFEPYQGQSYPIDLGSIELAKIGNYQDRIYKDEGKWYVEKQVGKVVLDGTESGWSTYTTNTAIPAYNLDITGCYQAPATSTVFNGMSDYYTQKSQGMLYAQDVDGISYRVNRSAILIKNIQCSVIAAFKTWLSTHNTTVYYLLATPTDTEITNETLINQLEALEQAHAYKGRTHVAAIAQSGNAPHIIEAEVQRSSDGNITNNGNIVSKPTLTIYGSGNIGVSLNGYQILEITLGDEEYITIDTAAMEAYKDTLDNLKNRLVNGDYSKFALRPGSNMIEFSGTVSKCVISKYSRWL